METSPSDRSPAARAGVRIGGEPSAQEAAAIIAAIEQFNRDTALPATPVAEPRPSAWKRAALTESVNRQPELPL